MLFGRKKPDFVQVETAATDQEMMSETSETEKPELLEYLNSLPEVRDDFDTEDSQTKSEEDGQAAVEATKAQKLAEYIRSRTKGTFLTSQSSLQREVEELESLLLELESEEEFKDIKISKGNQDCYYYSSDFMSDNYAMIAALVEEKDLAVTIAKMVRFNCKTYPVPTPAAYFERSPYFATAAQLDRAVSVLQLKKEYGDIKVFANSTQDMYFYSSEYMSDRYARALAEKDEFTD